MWAPAAYARSVLDGGGSREPKPIHLGCPAHGSDLAVRGPKSSRRRCGVLDVAVSGERVPHHLDPLPGGTAGRGCHDPVLRSAQVPAAAASRVRISGPERTRARTPEPSLAPFVEPLTQQAVTERLFDLRLFREKEIEDPVVLGLVGRVDIQLDRRLYPAARPTGTMEAWRCGESVSALPPPSALFPVVLRRVVGCDGAANNSPETQYNAEHSHKTATCYRPRPALMDTVPLLV